MPGKCGDRPLWQVQINAGLYEEKRMTAMNTLESIRETFRKADCFNVGWHERYDRMTYSYVLSDLERRYSALVSLPVDERTSEENRLIAVIKEWY